MARRNERQRVKHDGAGRKRIEAVIWDTRQTPALDCRCPARPGTPEVTVPHAASAEQKKGAYVQVEHPYAVAFVSSDRAEQLGALARIDPAPLASVGSSWAAGRRGRVD